MTTTIRAGGGYSVKIGDFLATAVNAGWGDEDIITLEESEEDMVSQVVGASKTIGIVSNASGLKRILTMRVSVSSDFWNYLSSWAGSIKQYALNESRGTDVSRTGYLSIDVLKDGIVQNKQYNFLSMLLTKQAKETITSSANTEEVVCTITIACVEDTNSPVIS